MPLSRANGFVVFPTFVADLFAMCGKEDLEIKSLTIKIFEEPQRLRFTEAFGTKAATKARQPGDTQKGAAAGVVDATSSSRFPGGIQATRTSLLQQGGNRRGKWQRMNVKQRIFRGNGFVVFPTFVADLFAMCGREDLEIKSLTIKTFSPFFSGWPVASLSMQVQSG